MFPICKTLIMRNLKYGLAALRLIFLEGLEPFSQML